MRTIFVINGSASSRSSNHSLIENIRRLSADDFQLDIFDSLKTLPHFDTELSNNNPPPVIVELRRKIQEADGIIICTPEYIFSIPSGLKNVIEWCVSTTIFENKPIGIVTASANGKMAHEELQLIMKTVSAKFTPETTLLIQGIKGKVDERGEIKDVNTKEELMKFIQGFRTLVNESVVKSF